MKRLTQTEVEQMLTGVNWQRKNEMASVVATASTLEIGEGLTITYLGKQQGNLVARLKQNKATKGFTYKVKSSKKANETLIWRVE
jgi:fibrillarin-like rRNA methylase